MDLPIQEILNEHQCYGNDRQVLDDQEKFFNNPLLSDIILCVGDERYYAHKLILVRASEVFEKMLSEEWKECSNNELNLFEEAECSRVFDKFLNFLYSCRINLNYEDAFPLLILADKYNISDLQKVVINYATNYLLPQIHLKELLNIWYHYAIKCFHTSLISACVNILAKKMDDLLLEEWESEWINLEKDQLTELLKSSELCLKNEYVLWKGVEKWLLHAIQKNSNQNIPSLLCEILCLVRFPMMTPNQLDEIENSCTVLTEKYSHFLLPYLAIGYKYHALSLNLIQKYFDQSRLSTEAYNFACLAPSSNNSSINLINPRLYIPPSHNMLYTSNIPFLQNLSTSEWNNTSINSRRDKTYYTAKISPYSNINNTENGNDTLTLFNGQQCIPTMVASLTSGQLLNTQYLFVLRNFKDTRWDKRITISDFGELRDFTEINIPFVTKSCDVHCNWNWELKFYPKGSSPSNSAFQCYLYANLLFDQARSIQYLLCLVGPNGLVKSISGTKTFAKSRYASNNDIIMDNIDKKLDLSDIVKGINLNELVVSTAPYNNNSNNKLTFQIYIKPNNLA